MTKHLNTWVGGLAMLAMTGAAQAQTKSAPVSCDESCLLGIAGDYMDGLTTNDATEVPLAPAVRATENGVIMPVTDGIWKTGASWTYRHTFVDPVQGGIGIFGSVAESSPPSADKMAMVSIRLKVAGRQIVESERLVAHKGDFSLFAPEWTTETKPIFRTVEPVETRSTRAQLEQIARNYFDALASGDPKRVAVHPDAVRFENGTQMTNSPQRGSASVNEGLRRFVYMSAKHQFRTPVIDTRRGLVWAVLSSDMPLMNKTIMVRGKPVEVTAQRHNLPRSLWLYELFKVENGRIVAIEAVMRNAALGADMGWGDPKR